ncbi:hypothetical protein N868_03615 [Cellulomonas carbonis T26]|uniref:Uncharacterized protein n=2 Tax=Cellulomonas carbonis TaxID=1386092 RepID=A0A0A0BNP2_9CELL|nr:hypothetical protein N868_03615 [Cellulomonas carbonis T26]
MIDACSTLVGMPSDPLSVETGAPWHTTLAERDRAGHERMADVARTTEAEVLERRLTALTAELAVLREAVAVRSRLLHEQSLALGEREARITALEARLADPRAARGPLPRRALRKARSVAGRAVRVVRAGVGGR